MANRKRNTKEAYLLEALRLFAQKGYEAVGVVELAQAVGCTTSALYKHYAGKQALFDAIIEKCRMGFQENMTRLSVDFAQRPREELLEMSEDELVDIVTALFCTVSESEYPRLFRQLVTVEQFKRPELAEIYNEHYIYGQFRSFSVLMQIMIDGGLMKQGDAMLMAVQLVSPVVLMIELCDRNPEKRGEALSLIEDHVRQFNRVYRS